MSSFYTTYPRSDRRDPVGSPKFQRGWRQAVIWEGGRRWHHGVRVSWGGEAAPVRALAGADAAVLIHRARGEPARDTLLLQGLRAAPKAQFLPKSAHDFTSLENHLYFSKTPIWRSTYTGMCLLCIILWLKFAQVLPCLWLLHTRTAGVCILINKQTPE